MTASPRSWIVGLGVLLAALVAFAWLSVRPPRDTTDRLSLAEAMASDTTGYARAFAPRPFVFPADHGPHPDFRSEWWYATGNLTGPQGERYGYELTIFRIALTPPGDTLQADAPGDAGTDSSGWASRQLYMAHFGVTDAAGRAHRAFERFSRGGAGLAGAQAGPFRVWLEGWAFEAAAGGMPSFTVRAAQDGYAVALTLRPAKPLVLQGDRGLSQKGPGAGNASHYYSMTRLETSGTVTTPRGTAAVTGTSWFDREWSTSALARDQVGWDWFALQLSDGRDLMLYQLRQADGAASRFSSGVLVDAAGMATHLPVAAYRLIPERSWMSPHSDVTYPVAWRIEVPSERLSLRETPVMDDQELNVSVRYWEGAVDVAGDAGLTGRGYLEMTGYGDRSGSGRGLRTGSE